MSTSFPTTRQSDASATALVFDRPAPGVGTAHRRTPDTVAWLSAACLLEPSVGVVWQAAFSTAQGVELRLHHHLLLAAALWLVYSFDHWVDGLRLRNRPILTARHAFMVQQRWPMAGVWGVVLAASLILSAESLSRAEWLSGVCLVAVTLAYFAYVHRGAGGSKHKELAVALIYTAGTTLFSWHGLTPTGVLAAGAFSALVLLNLTALACVERRIDEQHDHGSIASRRPTLGRDVRSGALALVALATLAGVVVSNWSGFFVSVAASAALLWGWLQLHTGMDHETNHLLADTALLLPLWSLWS